MFWWFFLCLQGIDKLNTKYSNWSLFLLGHVSRQLNTDANSFQNLHLVQFPTFGLDVTHRHWCWGSQETVALRVLEVISTWTLELPVMLMGPGRRKQKQSQLSGLRATFPSAKRRSFLSPLLSQIPSSYWHRGTKESLENGTKRTQAKRETK